MLRRAAAPAEDRTAEVDQVREALHGPLARLVGAAPECGWAALVDRASAVAGWGQARSRLLRGAVDPQGSEGPGATLDALWELVTELNERRHL